jgi:hypothetical protein
MALLGNGMMVFWHDFEGDETDFLHWHSYEHMPERVGIAGFRRGKRFAAVAGAPKYLTYYETESVDTLTSEAYLARLNDPTPWTKRNLAGFRNSNRTLCAIVASFGHGQGAAMLTIRLSPEAGKESNLARWLTDKIFPNLVSQPGFMGAHVLRGDEAASRTETDEKALRDTEDEVADWALMIEAITPAALVALRDRALSDSALADHGGRNIVAGIYLLQCNVAEFDLA